MGSQHRSEQGAAPGLVPEALIEQALRSGAQAAEVFQSQSLSRPVFFEANRLKQIESAQSAGTALRLWRDGRPGLAVAYGPVEASVLVARALALSDLNEPEEIDLADGTATAVYPDLGRPVPVEQCIEWGRAAIAAVRDVYPEVLCSAEWECDLETTRLVNSKGLDCGYSDTTLGCFMSTEWVRGDDFLYVSDGQTQRDGLSPDAIARQLIQRLAWASEAAAVTDRRVPVLFTSKAADMLWGTVQAALNGKQVFEGSSPWGGRSGSGQGMLADSRLGEVVLSDKLTIAQVPTEGPYSCPFDDEGTPTRALTFIDRGVLKSFYCDRTTGRRLGMGTTGNGFRPGLGSYATPGLFNFAIAPGYGTLEDLIKQLGNGLVVDQILGGGPGISGDFSINVDLGYWVRNGEIIGRVKDTMVAGNVYSALKQVTLLGGDADWNGSCRTPSMAVEGLSVTGRSG